MAIPSDPSPETGVDVSVTTEWADGTVVLSVSGDVDYVTAPQIRAAILQVLAERPAVTVLDLTGVSFLGSAGLSLLVEAKKVAEPGARVEVVAVGSAVLRPLQLTGLDGLLDVHPTVGQALAGPTV